MFNIISRGVPSALMTTKINLTHQLRLFRCCNGSSIVPSRIIFSPIVPSIITGSPLAVTKVNIQSSSGKHNTLTESSSTKKDNTDLFQTKKIGEEPKHPGTANDEDFYGLSRIVRKIHIGTVMTMEKRDIPLVFYPWMFIGVSFVNSTLSAAPLIFDSVHKVRMANARLVHEATMVKLRLVHEVRMANLRLVHEVRTAKIINGIIHHNTVHFIERRQLNFMFYPLVYPIESLILYTRMKEDN
jgi:hypothetical protein